METRVIVIISLILIQIYCLFKVISKARVLYNKCCVVSNFIINRYIELQNNTDEKSKIEARCLYEIICKAKEEDLIREE